MTAARRLGLTLLAGLVLLTGCSIGPGTIRLNMLRYNDAVADTENEQFLLNIVRLRYKDPPKSITVGSITSSFNVGVSGPSDFITGFNRGTTNENLRQYLGASGSYSDAPTVSFSPLNGGDYHGGLASPVPLSALVDLTNQGWDLDRLLRLFVYDMNGLENVPHLAGEGGERLPRFIEFVNVARTLGELQRTGRLELAVDPVPVPVGDLSLPTVVDKVGVSDLQKAADSHYLICATQVAETAAEKKDKKEPAGDKGPAGAKGDPTLVVMKNTVTAYDMNLAPDAWKDCNLMESARQLRLAPGAISYRLLPGDGGQFRALFDGPNANIFISTRSVIAGMLYLSRGIEVPEEHYRNGLVSQTLDDEGRPFDWTETTKGLFRIHSQKLKPHNAFVSVYYRGYWFYIADDDRTSKSSFDLMLELFDLEISRALTASPVLTVPVSAPSGGGAAGGGGGRRGG